MSYENVVIVGNIHEPRARNTAMHNVCMVNCYTQAKVSTKAQTPAALRPEMRACS